MSKKQLFTIILALFATMQVGAQTWNISRVTATLDANGTLTIIGEGALQWDGARPPWYSSRDAIKAIVIQNISPAAGRNITSIENNVFMNLTNLTSVNIPNTVSRIGNNAFKNSGLTSITIPDRVTTIGNMAFYNNTSLRSAIIGNGVTSIGDMAFANTGLTSITIPNRVTTIGGMAFYNNTSLRSAIIGDGVTTIGGMAFYGNTALTTVTIGTGVTTIRGDAFRHTSLEVVNMNAINWSTNHEWNSTWGVFSGLTSLRTVNFGNQVRYIPDFAFAHTGITSVTIPNSVISIGDFAFYNIKSLTSLTIGTGITSIGFGVFSGAPIETLNFNAINLRSDCEWSIFINATANLRTVNIGNQVQHIPRGFVVHSPALTNVTIPNSVISIGDCAFSGTGLTSVVIPNSVTSLGDFAFANNYSLTSVVIGDGVTSIGVFRAANVIGGGTFQNNPVLTDVVIGNSVTRIGDNAFSLTPSLTSITIPNSVTEIGHGAFNSSGLTSITIPYGVTTIGPWAFAGPWFYNRCRALTSVVIPSSVTYIGQRAFAFNHGLADVYVSWDVPPTMFLNTFYGVDTRDVRLHIPQGTLFTYKDSRLWREFHIVDSSGATYYETQDHSWLTVPAIEFIKSGNMMEVRVVGVLADTFYRLTVNGTEVTRTNGRWLVDISIPERREIRLSSWNGAVITRIHQR